MDIGSPFLVLSYVYLKQPIFGLTQEWLREQARDKAGSGWSADHPEV